MAKKNKTVAHEAWRPNFRNAERLPDIKLVRTDFLLNVVAIFAAAALLALFAYREYDASTLGDRVAELQAQVDKLNRPDQQSKALAATFTRDGQRLDEVARFMTAPVNPLEVLLRVAELQPPQSVLTQFEYQKLASDPAAPGVEIFRITIRGAMRPAAEKSATQLIDEFETTIRNMPETQGKLRRAELVSAERDPSSDRFNYYIILDVDPGTPAR